MNNADPGDAMDTKNSYRQPDPTPRTVDGPVRASTHRTPQLARWKASIITIIVATLVLTLAGVPGTAEAANTLVSNLGAANFGFSNDYKLSVERLRAVVHDRSQRDRVPARIDLHRLRGGGE